MFKNFIKFIFEIIFITFMLFNLIGCSSERSKDYGLGEYDSGFSFNYGDDYLTNEDILSNEILICGHKFILGKTTPEEIQNKLGKFEEDLYEDKNYYTNINSGFSKDFYFSTKKKSSKNYHVIRFIFKNLKSEKKQTKDFQLVGVEIFRYDDLKDDNDEVAIGSPISFNFGYDIKTGVTKSNIRYLLGEPIHVFDADKFGSWEEYEKDGYFFNIDFQGEKVYHIGYFKN